MGDTVGQEGGSVKGILCKCGHLIWEAQKLVEKGDALVLQKVSPPRFHHTNQEAQLTPSTICATCGCTQPQMSDQTTLDEEV